MSTDIDALRRKAAKEWKALRNSDHPIVLVGNATCGRSAGSQELLDTFLSETKKRKINCSIAETGCIGACYAEPIVCITLPGQPMIVYREITLNRAMELVERSLVAGEPVPEYALGTVGDGDIEGFPRLSQIPYFKPQVRRVLRNCGLIDPTNVNHYLAKDGYTGLEKALEITSEQIIEKVKKAGLRGRGGAGFPTWQKWKFCRDAKGDRKYLICNADEGDPGAFMNRFLIEGDPHAIVEGMVIAGRAIGADTSYIYCRAEYPLALERLRLAILQAENNNLLGDDILGSGFSFHIKIREGAGAFVCGEETALIASIEGGRGVPRPRPPFPAVSGLWGKPTIINNVESLANVALILQKGADWFAEYGSEQSKGTKTFALVGQVRNFGLVEVPLGITLREMIFEIGGGIPGDRPFKAVQTGGPSGGCLPAKLLDTPVDYDSLNAAGTIMGSGGMVVMDDTTCAVDFARYFLDFAQQESCGECVPCRLGTKQLLRILEDITAGKGKPEDIDLLLQLAESVKQGSLCGLGQTAPNPVLTTIRYFREEYEDHVKRMRCPAAACKEMISAPCNHTCPIETEAPLYISLIAAGRYQEAFDAIVKDNPLPSVCARVCHSPCEFNCQAGCWGKPIAIRALKRFAIDFARKAGIYPGKEKAKPTGAKVAVVGSGPAGLMAGYRLATRGYDVTIFEALSVPGGALAVCIPEYRLPREQLKADIDNIKNAGVEIKTNTRVGKEISFEQLRMDFKAVFLATGAHGSQKLGVQGEDAEGVMCAMDFLKDISLGNNVTVGKTVGVIGGGNSAIDAARAVLRAKGCEKVIIIYRRTRKEMPAFEEEVEAALEEGIEIRYLAAPTRVIANGGIVTGVECTKMKLSERDDTGRRRPVPIEGSEFNIALDTLVVAIGEYPDASFLEGTGLEVTKWDMLVADKETFATNLDGVFAGGDAVTGPNTVIDAMSAGKVAAEMIDKYLQGQPVTREYRLTIPSNYLPPMELTDEEVENADRPPVPTLPLKKRVGNFNEVDLPFCEEVAVAEARRCLRCDLQTRHAKEFMAREQTAGLDN